MKTSAFSRFQAQITPAWVIRQAEAGRKIEARRGREVEILHSPAIERLHRKQDEGLGTPIVLSKPEVERLAEILDRGFAPTPALRRVLSNLADPERKPPRLNWKKTAA